MYRRRDALCFNLGDMTEDELYEIDMIENDCVPIPSDRDSDNDSEAESISEGTAADVPADIFDNPDVGEIVVSDYAEDELSSSAFSHDLITFNHGNFVIFPEYKLEQAEKKQPAIAYIYYILAAGLGLLAQSMVRARGLASARWEKKICIRVNVDYGSPLAVPG
ncbi:hypothetical protein JTB14_017172 [Gonioctena quinquepunctata]|nr:hypothetical protein JTB14_017172 [Gonioctena quinquepunctata]